MTSDFLLLRGLAREQGHWGDFSEKLLKVPGVNSIHYVDLPGNGQYFKITSPVTIREMAEFIHSHNPISQPTTLLAVSMGAMIAIELVSLYPDSYKAAFLMNTSLSGISPLYQRLRPKSLETFYRILRSGTAREKEQHILKLVSNESDPERQEALVESWTRLAHARPTQLTNALRQLIAAGRYRLPAVKPLVPIFLMASERDQMVSHLCSQDLAEKWSLPIKVHESSGHELTTDAPDWVCDTIKFWLKEKPASVSENLVHPDS